MQMKRQDYTELESYCKLLSPPDSATSSTPGFPSKRDGLFWSPALNVAQSLWNQFVALSSPSLSTTCSNTMIP